MNSLESFENVVDTIYTASTDETLWPGVVEDVARASGGFGGSLVLRDTVKGYMPVSHHVGFAEGVFEEYGRVWVKSDPGAAAFRRQSHFTLYNDALLGMNAEVKARNGFYAWLLNASDQRHSYGARLFAGADFESTLILARSGAQGEAGEADLHRLGLFVRHLRRSIALSRKIGAHVSAAALDAMSFGVLIVNASGLVTFSNKAMDQMIADEDGLRLSNRGLSLHIMGSIQP